MKIQIISESFIGYNKGKISGEIFGGQELLLLETCKLLLERGDEVEVLQFGDKNEIINYQGIKIRKVWSPKLKFLERAGFIKRWTWAGIFFTPHIDKTADWIHLHNHHFSFPIRFFVRSQILTGMNHGVEWDLPWTYAGLSLKNIRDRMSFFLLKLVTRFSVKRLDKVITNDRFFIHYITSRRPDRANKFTYIPNYIDERVFDLDINPVKKIPSICEQISNFSKGKKIILLPKMSMKERGTDLMIDVMKKIDDAILIITGVSQQQDYYKSLVEDAGLSDKILFTGHISYSDELPFIFNQSDMVVIPSPCREATAISLLEGMSMGKPVLASEIGGLPEIVWNGYNGFLVYPSVDGFFHAIRKVLDDNELSKKISIIAKNDVYMRFSRKQWRLSMSEFFTKV
jgi:glycosyltransferase involved in cell wall biosynthesis